MPTPTLTFNPVTTVELTSTFVVLDPAAVVTDGGNALNGMRIWLGGTTGSIGILSGTALLSSGNVGPIVYTYLPARRLLTLLDNTGGQTATGADFTAALRLVAYDRGSSAGGTVQTININLGTPIYFPATGHYYDLIAGSILGSNAAPAANAKTFLGLTGYLTNITTAIESTFLTDRFKSDGWIGGNSLGTMSTVPRIWRWGAGPELNTIFWTGDLSGSGPAGSFSLWPSGRPANNGNSASTTNTAPYLAISGSTGGFWYELPGSQASGNYFVEYSTASGTGDDGLSGTRKTFSILVNYDPVIIALQQAAATIEVSIVNGVATNAIGVLMSGVTIDSSDPIHTKVTVDLGTTTNGKRRNMQCFRIFANGYERNIGASMNRLGEAYIFTFLKITEGSNSVNLVLK